jgi:DNA-binding FadR family transcriptional regulator
MNGLNPWQTPAMLGDGVSLSPIRASDNAERYLRSLIYSGLMGPGDRLPPERELSAQLGIATVTLRAALRSLEDAGLIVVRLGAHGGSYVSDVETLQRKWHEWATSHQDQLRQILEFRGPIDILTASLAAERRTPAELEAIEVAIRMHAENSPAAVRWHLAFHDALSAASHNAYLQWAALIVRGELFVPVDRVMQEEGFDEILGLHRRLLAAVRDRDSARAEEEMRLHLELTTRGHFP